MTPPRPSTCVGLVALATFVLAVTFSAPAVAQQKKAIEANKAGLKAHKRGKFVDAQAHFERAMALDPSYDLPVFNAACAASRAGALSAGRAHVETWLQRAPANTAQVLHDPDLAALRGEATFMASLRARLRPKGVSVRPLVYERRDLGDGDLFLIGEDGLDEVAVAVTPGVREHDARFSARGTYILYRSTPNTNLHRFRLPWRARYDDTLHAYNRATGKVVVLGEGVQDYRLSRDGDAALFVKNTGESKMRVSPPLEIHKVPLKGGAAEVVAKIGQGGDAWCYDEAKDGSLVVAQGSGSSWGVGLHLRVTRYKDGKEVLIRERGHPRLRDAQVWDFQICQLSADDKELHVGQVRIALDPDEPITGLSGLDFGYAPYGRALYGSRGAISPDGRTLFMTVDGRAFESYTISAPPKWKVSPLSYEDGDGRSDEMWKSTVIKRLGWDGSGSSTLTKEKGKRIVSEYGPNVSSQGDALVFTRVSLRGKPWVVRSKLDGSDARAVVPGQYPVFGPVGKTVEDDGQILFAAP